MASYSSSPAVYHHFPPSIIYSSYPVSYPDVGIKYTSCRSRGTPLFHACVYLAPPTESPAQHTAVSRALHHAPLARTASLIHPQPGCLGATVAHWYHVRTKSQVVAF